MIEVAIAAAAGAMGGSAAVFALAWLRLGPWKPAKQRIVWSSPLVTAQTREGLAREMAEAAKR